MSKEKIMLSILKELDEFNIPTEKDYDIDIKKFYRICKSLESGGFLSQVSDLQEYNDGSCDFSLKDSEITVSGINYIRENSSLYKGYKGLKEIREWMPF